MEGNYSDKLHLEMKWNILVSTCVGFFFFYISFYQFILFEGYPIYLRWITYQLICAKITSLLAKLEIFLLKLLIIFLFWCNVHWQLLTGCSVYLYTSDLPIYILDKETKTYFPFSGTVIRMIIFWSYLYPAELYFVFVITFK